MSSSSLPTRPRRPAPTAWLLLLLSAPACAGAGGAPAAGPSPAPDCRLAAEPAALPPAAGLVDAAALGRDLAALWEGAGRPAGHVLLSLRYDRHGINVRRAVIERAVPAALADSVQALVFAHRRQTEPAAGEWGVRLRVEPAADTPLTVARGELCPPRPPERLAAEAWGWEALAPSWSAAAPGPRVWVRVALDARGRVTDAELERGAVDHERWSRDLLSYVRTLAFRPAVEDGHPVPAELAFPLRVGR